MSKFRNRIRDAARTGGGFGFAALAQREQRRYMLVVASAATVEEAEAAANAGADAVILDDATRVAAAVERVSVPVGVRLLAASGADVVSARDAGADFFVFDDGTTHAAALATEDIGAVLVLGADQQEDRLRAVAAIDLDALVVEVEPGTVTVRGQIELRRVATMTGAPLLVSVQEQAPDTAALEAWRDAGAPLVLVPAALTESTLAAAAEVPAPQRRRRERDVPMLGAPPHVPDLDDDDHDH